MSDQVMEVEKQENELIETTEEERPVQTFAPRVDIYSTEEGFVLLADMPGVAEDGIDITLEKDVLTVEGQVAPTEPEGYKLAYREYRIGNYKRSFTLSDEVDRDGIEAVLSNGVLHITLPKAEAAKTKKIAVKGL